MKAAASLAQQAYDHLLERILSGALPPGTLLNRRSVADELGFSVAPVLEAVVQLESEGLLESLARKGTRVRLASPARQYDLCILREALECQAARLYCGAPIAKNWAELSKLATHADDLAGDLWQAEVAFHRALVGLADSPLLLSEFERHVRMGFFFALQQTLAPRTPRGISLHRELLLRVKRPDPDAAERAVREHMSPSREQLDALRKMNFAALRT